MLQKDGSLLYKNFQVGGSESPHLGFSFRNLDVYDVPGVVKIHNKTSLKYSTNGLPRAIVRDIYGNEYVGTDTGYFYKNGVLISSGLGDVSDMKMYKDYIIITRRSASSLAIYGPVTSGAAFLDTGWKTGFSTGYEKPIIIGQDDIAYIGNGNNVASISSFVAGIPPASPTATLNLSALDLPEGQFVRSLAELGRYLMIGTQGGSSATDFNYGIGNIYPWDRSSSSFEMPIQLNESGVHQMLSQGDHVIAHAGPYGNVYKVNTISFSPYKKINFNKDRNATAYPNLNAIAKLDDELLIGTSTLSDTFPSQSIHGIWSLKNGPILRNTISTGNFGSSANLKIGAIIPISGGSYKSILVGWSDGANSGVDEIIGFQKYSSFQAFFETAFEIIGSRNDKKALTECEITLAKPLVAGQSIRISTRKNLTDDYTVMATLDTTNTSAGELSHIVKAGITNAVALQTKVELSQTSSVVFPGNIELKQVEIRP